MEKVAGNSNYLDTDFIHENSRECTLLFEFHDRGFSYTIFNNIKNKILFSAVSKSQIDFFSATETQLDAFFQKQTVFKFSFSKVIVLLDHLYSTLVPLEFYDAGKKKEILAFNIKLPKVDLVFKEDFIDSINYYNIYVNTKQLESSLQNHFVGVEIHSTKSFLIRNAKEILPKGNFFQMHLNKNLMHLLYYKKSDLIYSNSFVIDTPEDVVFNVLNVYSQLGLNNERTVLNLSGKISEKDDLYELLYTYIKNIEFLKKPLRINYEFRVNKIPDQYFLHHYLTLV